MDSHGIIHAIVDNNGGTFRVKADGTFVPAQHRTGYYVALGGCEGLNPLQGITNADVESYVDAYRYAFGFDDRFFGVWNDAQYPKAMVYFDVSMHVRSRKVAEDLGRQNKQLAIWDIAAESAITL